MAKNCKEPLVVMVNFMSFSHWPANKFYILQVASQGKFLGYTPATYRVASITMQAPHAKMLPCIVDLQI